MLEVGMGNRLFFFLYDLALVLAFTLALAYHFWRQFSGRWRR